MLRPRRLPWSMFVNFYGLFEIQSVINQNMRNAPGDYEV